MPLQHQQTASRLQSATEDGVVLTDGAALIHSQAAYQASRIISPVDFMFSWEFTCVPAHCHYTCLYSSSRGINYATFSALKNKYRLHVMALDQDRLRPQPRLCSRGCGMNRNHPTAQGRAGCGATGLGCRTYFGLL